MTPIRIPGNNRPEDAGRMIQYITNGKKSQGAVWCLNVSSPELAAIEIQATASQGHYNTRNPLLHQVIAWAPGETPTRKQAIAAARKFLKGRGLQAHQAVVAMHFDTDIVHMHIIVNRIHPQTFRSNDLPWHTNESQRIVREIEIEQGWSHTDGAYVVVMDDAGEKYVVPNPDKSTSKKSKQKNRANAFATRTGHQSFADYITDIVAPQLKRHFDKTQMSGQSWDRLHHELARLGCAIAPRRGGYIVFASNQGEPPYPPANYQAVAKLSDIKAAGWEAGTMKMLATHLGEFHPPGEPLPEPNTVYDPGHSEAPEQTGKAPADVNPKTPSPIDDAIDRRTAQKLVRKEARDSLYAEYQQDKTTHDGSVSRRRQQAWATQNDSQKARRAAIHEAFRVKRRKLRQEKQGEAAKFARAALDLEKAKALEKLNLAILDERKALKALYDKQTFTSWRDWVAEKALHDKRAKSALRGIRYREQRPSLCGSDPKQPPARDLGKAMQTCMALDKSGVLEDIDIRSNHATSRATSRTGLTELRQEEERTPWAEYFRGDKLVARDFGHKIIVKSEADRDIEAMTMVAASRFGGSIKIDGPEDFILKATAFAVIHGINVVNPDLQDIVSAFKESAKQDRAAKRDSNIKRWIADFEATENSDLSLG